MKIADIIVEAATAIVYHYAGVSAAAKILTSGVFQLSSITGNKSEEPVSDKLSDKIEKII